MMDESTGSLINEYLIESREHLASIETDLLAVEARGADIDEDLVNKVFRAAHSIKGGAAFFDLKKIGELAHKTENVLQMVRSRQMVPSPEVVNILLQSFDRLRDLINNPQTSEKADISEILLSLKGLTSSYLPAEKKETIDKKVAVSLPSREDLFQVSEFDLNQARQCGHSIYVLAYDLIHDIERVGLTPLSVLRSLISFGTILDATVDVLAIGDLDSEVTNQVPFYVLLSTLLEPAMMPGIVHLSEEKITLIEKKKEGVTPVQAPVIAAATPAPAPVAQAVIASAPAAPAAPAAPSGPAPKETTLRVGINVLESLMNLAGELVLSRNQLVEAISKNDQRALNLSGQRINLVTSELQEAIMMTRMQPIGNVFSKFPRVVRDLSKELKKEIQLDMFGKDIEMDKTLIEGLSDPLTHMIRNAVDHGIEIPEKRQAAGKKALGHVKLNAFHQAGQVVIEIIDDGKGIDGDRVVASALSKGLITKEQAKAMSEKEKYALIFLPGLSTAEKVTDVSGRGVGMDVVKTNLDKLGGKVDIDSVAGKGTTFRIKLPLTLAIIPSLLVSVSDERFAVPQVNVSELIRIPANQIKSRIEKVGSSEVLVLRGALIPVVHLAEVFGIQRTFTDAETGELKPTDRTGVADRRTDSRVGGGRRYHAASDLNIVIVNSGAFNYGLVVDRLHDSLEIVVKPLGRDLKDLREYAGAAILGDGRVALILDVAGLAAKMGVHSLAGTQRAKELESAENKTAEQRLDMHSFLLFRNLPHEQCAVPLDLVSRIEQIQAKQIETIGGKLSMQYRGASLPLVALKDSGKFGDLSDSQDRVVIVFNMGGRDIGLLAAKPLDVIETDCVVDASTLQQPGLLGTSIIRGMTTLIVDMHGLLEMSHPEWIGERKVAVQKENGEVPTILLAEDSDFFRNQVKKFLEEAGYKVLAGEDGQVAWELLQANPDKVQLLVTDVEMPRMTGLELATAVRADGRFKSLPIIAVTSLAGDEDMAKGKLAGIDDYQVKLDREKLIQSIQSKLSIISKRRDS